MTDEQPTGHLSIFCPAPAFVFEVYGSDRTMIARMNLDGTMTFAEGATPEGAAKLFWKYIEGYARDCMRQYAVHANESGVVILPRVCPKCKSWYDLVIHPALEDAKDCPVCGKSKP